MTDVRVRVTRGIKKVHDEVVTEGDALSEAIDELKELYPGGEIILDGVDSDYHELIRIPKAES